MIRLDGRSDEHAPGMSSRREWPVPATSHIRHAATLLGNIMPDSNQREDAPQYRNIA